MNALIYQSFHISIKSIHAENHKKVDMAFGGISAVNLIKFPMHIITQNTLIGRRKSVNGIDKDNLKSDKYISYHPIYFREPTMGTGTKILSWISVPVPTAKNRWYQEPIPKYQINK